MTTLDSLLDVIDASPVALRRDRCGDWAITGKLGHVYQDGDSYLLCVTTDESSRRWTNVKQRLAFCHVSQDGDDEGCLRLDCLSAPYEQRRSARHRVSGSGGTCARMLWRKLDRQQSELEPV
jgi:hypothetical protein